MDQAFIILAIIGFQSAVYPSSQSQAAASQAARAYYEQAGIDRDINALVNRNSTPELRAWFGDAALLTKTVIDQKITFKWEFP